MSKVWVHMRLCIKFENCVSFCYVGELQQRGWEIPCSLLLLPHWRRPPPLSCFPPNGRAIHSHSPLLTLRSKYSSRWSLHNATSPRICTSRTIFNRFPTIAFRSTLSLSLSGSCVFFLFRIALHFDYVGNVFTFLVFALLDSRRG